jgi:hypothetical protein
MLLRRASTTGNWDWVLPTQRQKSLFVMVPRSHSGQRLPSLCTRQRKLAAGRWWVVVAIMRIQDA